MGEVRSTRVPYLCFVIHRNGSLSVAAPVAAFPATRGGGAGARAWPSEAAGTAGGRRSGAEDLEDRLFCFAMQSGRHARGGK